MLNWFYFCLYPVMKPNYNQDTTLTWKGVVFTEISSLHHTAGLLCCPERQLTRCWNAAGHSVCLMISQPTFIPYLRIEAAAMLSFCTSKVRVDSCKSWNTCSWRSWITLQSSKETERASPVCDCRQTHNRHLVLVPLRSFLFLSVFKNEIRVRSHIKHWQEKLHTCKCSSSLTTLKHQ